MLGSGDSRVQERLEQHAGPDGDLSADWEADYQRTLAAQAMERVKGEFQSRDLECICADRSGRASAGRRVAASVGLSVGAIYVAKSRVIARLRQEIERMQGDEP